MKYAADFRGIARGALSGRWGIAVVAGLVASMLGGLASQFEVNIDLGGADLRESIGLVKQQFDLPGISGNEEMIKTIIGVTGIVFLFVMAIAVAFFILGSIVALGYSRFNLDLIDREKEPDVGTLFHYFSHWKTAAAAKFLQTLYAFFWALLFIIPGIVASYSYAMTEYILAENPELTANEAITQSKEMMDGNRGRLFCLNLSFIGWDILCAFSLGIGNLWLTPYKQAAIAAFYREVSGTEQSVTAGEIE